MEGIPLEMLFRGAGFPGNKKWALVIGVIDFIVVRPGVAGSLARELN